MPTEILTLLRNGKGRKSNGCIAVTNVIATNCGHNQSGKATLHR